MTPDPRTRTTKPAVPFHCPKCPETYPHFHCRHCDQAVVEPAGWETAICGQPACRAREHWGPSEWAGRARMAAARAAAGVALDDLDRDALAHGATAPTATTAATSTDDQDRTLEAHTP